MITVNYLDGVDNIRCDEHLFQWDNGQKLCLSGLNTYVPNLETVDVHFCNKISKLAITVKPTVVSNNIVAPIPNSLLQDPYPIIAYFYVPSDNGSRTIVMVTIPIEPKKRPSDFILNEDEAIASLEVINNKVNTTLNNITVDYNNFKIRIEKELQDTVENLQLEDAKTLQSHPASDFVLKVNLPTSLPASGGNADTVDGKHASEFMPYIGVVSDLCAVNQTCICMYTSDTLNTPFKAGVTSSGAGICIVNFSAGAEYVNYLVMPAGEINHYTAVSNNDTLVTNWERISNNGNADTVDGKHASEFVLKTEMPTSLPANGGNADTVDGKHANEFMPYIGVVSDLFAVNQSCICAYTSDTLNTPLKAGLTSSGAGLCIVNCTAGSAYENYLVIPAGDINYCCATSVNGVIGANWQRINDGGNASTVNGVKLMVGTREPQCEEPNALAYVPEGAWYGRY